MQGKRAQEDVMISPASRAMGIFRTLTGTCCAVYVCPTYAFQNAAAAKAFEHVPLCAIPAVIFLSFCVQNQQS